MATPMTACAGGRRDAGDAHRGRGTASARTSPASSPPNSAGEGSPERGERRHSHDGRGDDDGEVDPLPPSLRPPGHSARVRRATRSRVGQPPVIRRSSATWAWNAALPAWRVSARLVRTREARVVLPRPYTYPPTPSRRPCLESTGPLTPLLADPGEVHARLREHAETCWRGRCGHAPASPPRPSPPVASLRSSATETRVHHRLTIRDGHAEDEYRRRPRAAHAEPELDAAAAATNTTCASRRDLTALARPGLVVDEARSPTVPGEPDPAAEDRQVCRGCAA